MTPEDFATYIARLDDAFNRRDLTLVAEFYAEDAVRIMTGFGEFRGRAEITRTRQALLDAYSDVQWKTRHSDLSLKLGHPSWGGEFGFVEWTFKGTHTGMLTMPQGAVPPTGTRVEINGISAFEFDRQGKVTEERVYFDYVGLLVQIGQEVVRIPSQALTGLAKGRPLPKTRTGVLAEIKEHFGTVPEWLSKLPEGELEHDWALISSVELGETAIPNKYKELMGLAVASALRCRYCTFFHAETAKLFGATEDEIREAVLMAKLTSGLSTYLSGGQFDHERFKKETADMVGHVRKARTRKAA